MRDKLVAAVDEGDLSTTRSLLNEGVDPAEESESGAGDSAIHMAANSGNLELLTPLVEAWLERDSGAIKSNDILWHVLFNGQVEAGRYLAD